MITGNETTSEVEKIQTIFKEDCNWNKEIGYFCKMEVKILWLNG